ncbi:MAG: type II toxin-antitoxin system mRNA interferase toxin, RelE/StbE family [Patescibacteria group bacterium]
MDFQISPDLEKELKKIKSKDLQLIRRIEKQLNLFQQNHLHPSLRVHKLSGNLKNIWSIAIDKNYRMLFVYDDNGVYFFDIGTHDQVYK